MSASGTRQESLSGKAATLVGFWEEEEREGAGGTAELVLKIDSLEDGMRETEDSAVDGGLAGVLWCWGKLKGCQRRLRGKSRGWAKSEFSRGRAAL